MDEQILTVSWRISTSFARFSSAESPLGAWMESTGYVSVVYSLVCAKHLPLSRAWQTKSWATCDRQIAQGGCGLDDEARVPSTPLRLPLSNLFSPFFLRRWHDPTCSSHGRIFPSFFSPPPRMPCAMTGSSDIYLKPISATKPPSNVLLKTLRFLLR